MGFSQYICEINWSRISDQFPGRSKKIIGDTRVKKRVIA